MSQVEINVLKQAEPSRKVISACFFTMEDAYRPVAFYEKRLDRFLKMARNKTGFEIRIYTDDSGKNIVMKQPDISVYHFNYQPLRESIGHIGTFGTLMRFLPMFEDLDTVWISDIDIPELVMPKFTTPIFYNELSCYEMKVYGRNHTIVADRIITHQMFPMSILTRFINKLTAEEVDIDGLNLQNKYKPKSKVPYGIDELFLNTSVYDYLKRHEISVTTSKSYLLNTGFYRKAGFTNSELLFAYEYYSKPNPADFGKIKELYKRKIAPLIERYSCLQGLFDVLDRLPYTMKKIESFSYSVM